MSMSPYILVLAQTSHEGAKYVRRANLPRGRWRIVAKASSIHNVRKAEVHCLPGFHRRPDKHSIMAKLRYAKVDWLDVEMPLTDSEIAALEAIPWTIDERSLEVAYRYNRLRDLADEEAEFRWRMSPEGQAATTAAAIEQISEALDDDIAPDERPNTDEPVEPNRVPKAKRRRMCGECGTLHFKDEPCARVDGVKETPAAAPVVFDS